MNAKAVCPHCSHALSSSELAGLLSGLSESERARLSSSSSLRAPSSGPVGRYVKVPGGGVAFVMGERAEAELEELRAAGA